LLPEAESLGGTVPHLPHPCALVLNEYLLDKDPFIKLWRMVDCVELTARITGIVLFCDLLRKGIPLAGELKSLFAEGRGIDGPTFAWWRRLNELCVSHLPVVNGSRNCFVSELPNLVLRTLSPTIGSGKDRGVAQFLALRNNLFHLKWFLDRDAATALVKSHEESFFALMKELDFWRSYLLLGVTAAGTTVKLQGLAVASNADGYHHADVEHVVIVRRDQASDFLAGNSLDLYPFLAIESLANDGRSASAIVDLYLRRTGPELSYSRFTAMSPCPASSQVLRANRFRIMAPVDEWRREMIDRKEPWAPASFQPFIEECAADFVGRDGADNSLELARSKAMTAKEGILWLSGSPGGGKTAFMAMLAKILSSQPDKILIPYFFRSGEAGHSADEFYRYALFHLYRLGRRTAAKERIEQPQQSLLRELQARSNDFTQTGIRMLFLLDGLDEIFRWEPLILNFLAQASLPGVVWFCAGRPEEGLEQFLERQKAHWVFEDGLPPMNEDEVRHMILDQADRRKYEAVVHKTFVTTLTRKSEGLPLYIKLAIQDFNRNEWGIGQEDRLPQGLSAYFETLIQRWHIDSVGSVTAPIFCLLAWAREPVTEEMLTDLLAAHHLSHLQGFAELVREALRRAHPMLRQAPTSEGTQGSVLYHESFRSHLLSTERVRPDREWARTRWVQRGTEWQETENVALDNYMLRHCSWHLFNGERWEDLFALALNPDVWKKQNESIPDAPELSLRTLRDAIAGAIASDNAVAMAKLILAHAQRATAIRSESPVSALRRTSLRRALALADLREPNSRACWHLLIAWDQIEAAELIEAAATLDRLYSLVLPGFDPSDVDSSLVNLLLGLTAQGWKSGEIFLEVCRKMVGPFYLPSLIAVLRQREQVDYASQLALGLEKGREKAETFGALAAKHWELGRQDEGRKLLDIALVAEAGYNAYTANDSDDSGFREGN
jgi:hypothetical protein